MPAIWPQATIRELLAKAEADGEAIAELATADDAVKFRYSIYSFREGHDIGLNTTITLDGNKVVVTRKEKPQVVILQEQRN